MPQRGLGLLQFLLRRLEPFRVTLQGRRRQAGAQEERILLGRLRQVEKGTRAAKPVGDFGIAQQFLRAQQQGGGARRR